MANVGSAYISIYPSLEGFGSKIKAALSGIDVSGIGGKLGSQIGDGLDGGLSKASKSASRFSGKLSALAGVAGGVAAELAGRLFGSVMNLGSEMVEASDSAQKFARTLSFAGIDDSTIQQLTASTQEYADQTVYDLADIRNATAQLAANGVDNYAQLAEAAGNLNAVAGGNAETFKSVSMVMSQTAGSGKLMTENWNQLTDAIPGASGALQEAMRSAGAFEGNFREAMENGEISADEFFAAVQQLGMQDVAVQAATSTSTIEGAMGNLQASVVGVGSQLITALNPIITGAMNALAGAISQIPSLFSAAGSALAPFADQMSNIGTVIAPLVTTFLTQLGGLVSSMLPVLGSIASTVASIASQVVSFVVGTIVPIVLPAITSIVATVQSAMPLIQAVISAVLAKIQAVWNVVWPAIQAVVSTVFSIISTVIQTVMGVIQGVISAVMAIINGDWDAAWEAIKGIADTVWNGISSIVDTVLPAISGFISGALSTIQGIWDSAWSTVSSVLSGAWDAMTSTVSSAIDGVIQFFMDLPGNILSALGDLGSLLLDAGGQIVQGLIDGIQGAIGGVGDAIMSGVSGAVESFKSFLGIASPSKLFRQFGGYTMEGFALGISDEESAPVRALRSAMTTVEDVMEASGVISTTIAAGADGAASSSASAGPSPAQLLARIVELLEMIYQVIPEGMSAKDRARFARKAVAYGI